MKLCYLYNQHISLNYYDEIVNSFENVCIDLSTQSIPHSEVYIIDLPELTKELSLRLKETLEHKKSLIYFYVPQKHTMMHVQLAVLLQSKSILTQKQDVNKVIRKIDEEYQEFLDQQTKQVQKESVKIIETRLGFLEMLKDKLLNQEKNLALITIAFKNLDLRNLKETLQVVKKSLDTSLQLAQYNGEFYIALYENQSFELIKEQAKKLNEQLNQYSISNETVLLSQVYAVDLAEMEFEDILEMLYGIEKNKVSDDLIINDQICFIENMEQNKSDEYILQQMLNTLKFNQVELKLLNIYKGLVINSKASVVKIDEKFIQLELKNLQTEVVALEKKTILEIPGYTQTIELILKHINIQKGIATFEKPTLIKASINARKHGRVTCERDTNIAISAEGTSVKGSIIDISLVSIAVKLPYSKVLDKLEGKDVLLNFELSLIKNHVINSVIRKAKVQKVFVNEEKKIAKIVCDFYESHDSEYILMEYIFERQKSIIREIKKAALKA
ncbi:hypothetical protein [Sulfurimonas sp. C5]|uniref:hypothetical protein n=1 Tax=Sulfurimonas sp. C5 TaxID=3036947 RepID=UPI002455009A|nr:hypothetical protein [Sulfurimonas sp. C5]MDH4944943.1 hypothetical protein [Sulfurimonas sp. C5]